MGKETCGICSAPPSGGACKDDDGNCKYYTSYCNTDHIKNVCKKTCGNCACEDDDGMAPNACALYKSHGYCSIENVKKQCAKTCGICSAPPSGGACKDDDGNCKYYTSYCND